MTNTRAYEQLLELPLFLGMSLNDVDAVVGRTKMGFHKATAGRPIVSEGDACTHLLILTGGSITTMRQADDGSYVLHETMNAPAVLQPEHLFGFTQRYTRTFIAKDACQYMSLSKAEVLRLTECHEIFRLNLLNMVCTLSQRTARHAWKPPAGSIRKKVVRFLEARVLRPAGPKRLYIKMQTLADEIAESRLNVSHELKQMHAEGLIRLSRGAIDIPAFEHLISSLP